MILSLVYNESIVPDAIAARCVDGFIKDTFPLAERESTEKGGFQQINYFMRINTNEEFLRFAESLQGESQKGKENE